MYCGIVKLNPLTNPDWTGTKYNYFFLVRRKDFILCFVSRVIVRRCCFELGRTCIYHFVYRAQVMRFTELSHLCLSLVSAAQW
ncbi:hypothetical protein D3C73_1218830 [compost metagenome]